VTHCHVVMNFCHTVIENISFCVTTYNSFAHPLPWLAEPIKRSFLAPSTQKHKILAHKIIEIPEKTAKKIGYYSKKNVLLNKRVIKNVGAA
jgi:hypothetical protein